MDRVFVFVLLLGSMISWSLAGRAQDFNPGEYARQSEQAYKRQQKTARKALKKDRKAIKKYLKAQQKAIKKENQQARTANRTTTFP